MIRQLSTLLLIFVLVPVVYAADSYKPYLHKASVPDHPELEQYGSYSSSLFPGAATYSLDLEVAKGVHDLEPALKLQYNSQSSLQQNIIGNGWSMTENYILRDINHSALDTSDDFYRLSLNNNNYKLVYDGTRYHTDVESYLYIEQNEDSWIVRSRSGLVYRFGNKNLSRLYSSYGYVHKWYLDDVTDTYGNRLNYSYVVNLSVSDINAYYPSVIEYNGQQRIIFKYDPRDDSYGHYIEGSLTRYSHRLKEIEIYSNDTFVIRYHLNYSYLNQLHSVSGLSSIGRYGRDNESLLYSIGFSYYGPDNNYTKGSFKIPEYFATVDGSDKGLRLVDLNRDGLVDLARGGGSTKYTWLNNGTAWVIEPDYYLPTEFVEHVGDSYLDKGARFLDLNNDGLIDIIKSFNHEFYAWLNNGSGWELAPEYDPPIEFGNGSLIDRGVRLMDLNGDGLTDLLQCRSYDLGSGIKYFKSAWLNNGHGWTNVSSIYECPELFVDYYNRDNGVRAIDLNNDGLTDIIRARNMGTKLMQCAWLNNGTGWTRSEQFDPPLIFVGPDGVDRGVRLFDINSDGLPDIIEYNENSSIKSETTYLNNGSGWYAASGWDFPEPFMFKNKNVGRRLSDINGDSLIDIVVSYDNSSSPYNYTWIKNSSTPYLLMSVSESYGGRTMIDYGFSTQYISEDSQLGFVVNVVKSVEVNNGMLDDFFVISNTSYAYTGAKYDYDESEFRGFRLVNETRPDKSLILHYYLQDDGAKGKEYRTDIINLSGDLMRSVEHNYLIRSSAKGYYIVQLGNTTTSHYDGDETSFITCTSYEYDDYGNVVAKIDHGDLEEGEDDVYEYSDYVINSTAWIIDKPSKVSVYGADNYTLVKQEKYSYDNNDFGEAPVMGSVTAKESYHDLGIDPVVQFQYDDRGNLIKETNSRGYSTSYRYDVTGTYMIESQNPLGHKTLYNYDTVTGKLLSKNVSGLVSTYLYDVHGRVLKEIQPYDDSLSPTKEYFYYSDGVAPELVIVRAKQNSTLFTETYYFYDGLGKLIQLKSPYSLSKQTIKDFYYDSSQRLYRESNPYIVQNSTMLQSPGTSVGNTVYSYDALDRVVAVSYPDGTSDQVVFNKTMIDTYDRNGNRRSYILDGHDRISNVLEYMTNNYTSEIYNTSYEYDALGNLLKITDSRSNEFNFSYDSLGRKILLDDPDLGVWVYGYDSEGNLVNQTNNENQLIELGYDGLDRVIWKNSSNRSIEFRYDIDHEGTLYSINSTNFTFFYQYDDRLRTIREIREIIGYWFGTGNGYNSMDKIIKKHIATGEELSYSYDLAGRLDKIAGYIDSITYTEFGLESNISYSNGLDSLMSYDNLLGRLTQIKTGPIQQLDYNYDNVGNIVSIDDLANDRNQSMEYDSLGRLTRAEINSDVYLYDYNSIGSIMSVTENNRTKRYSYNSAPAHAPSSILDRVSCVAVRHPRLVGFGRNQTLEFVLVNERGDATSNVTVTIDFGDGVVVESAEELVVNDYMTIITNHSYAHAGTYTIMINTTSPYCVDETSFSHRFGIASNGLTGHALSMTDYLFRLFVHNDMVETSAGVNWSCDHDLKASALVYVSSNNTSIIELNHNYSSPGKKSFSCNISSDDGNDSAAVEFRISALEVSDASITTLDSSNKVFGFIVTNHYYPLDTVSWEFYTDHDNISSSRMFNLSTGDSVIVLVEQNYSTPGNKDYLMAVESGSVIGTNNGTVVVRGVNIDDFDRVALNKTSYLFAANIRNYWPGTQQLSWQLNDPSISSSYQTELNTSQALLLFIEADYSVQGTKNIEFATATAIDTNHAYDSFAIDMIDIEDYRVLEETQQQTTHAITVRNNYVPSLISFRHDSGETNITNSFELNQSQAVFMFIETNYTDPGEHPTETYINSSIYNDQKHDVVVVR